MPSAADHKRYSAMNWLVYWNGKSFDEARSNEEARENGLTTFAYRIILNMNGLRANEPET